MGRGGSGDNFSAVLISCCLPAGCTLISAAQRDVKSPAAVFAPLKPWRVQAFMLCIKEGGTAWHHRGAVAREYGKGF